MQVRVWNNKCESLCWAWCIRNHAPPSSQHAARKQLLPDEHRLTLVKLPAAEKAGQHRTKLQKSNSRNILSSCGVLMSLLPATTKNGP
jgi:hypothetical protein